MVKYQKHPTSSKQGYACLWSPNTAINSTAELTGEKQPRGETFSERKSLSKKKKENKQKKEERTSRKNPKNQIRKSYLLFFSHLKIKQLPKLDLLRFFNFSLWKTES